MGGDREEMGEEGGAVRREQSHKRTVSMHTPQGFAEKVENRSEAEPETRPNAAARLPERRPNHLTNSAPTDVQPEQFAGQPATTEAPCSQLAQFIPGLQPSVKRQTRRTGS